MPDTTDRPDPATPTREASDVLEVTQADREAAIENYDFDRFLSEEIVKFEADVRAGKEDDNYMVQAFARHRIEALASISPTPPAVGEGEAGKDWIAATYGTRWDDEKVRHYTYDDMLEAFTAALATLRPSPDAIREALEECHEVMHECTAVLSASDCAKVAAAMAKARAALATSDPIRGAFDALKAERALPLQGPEHGAWDRGRRYGLDDAIRIVGRFLATPEGRATDKGETEVTFEVWERDELMVASSTDEADARHYLAVYSQDGPVRLVRAVTTRTEIVATLPTDQGSAS